MEKPDIFKRENTLLVVNLQDLEVIGKWIGKIILDNQPNTSLPPDEERPLSQPEAIKFLGKSRQTFYAYRKKGIINAYRLAGRIYYKKAELLNALEKLG